MIARRAEGPDQALVGLATSTGVAVAVAAGFGAGAGWVAWSIAGFWLVLVGPPPDGPRADRVAALIAASTCAGLVALAALWVALDQAAIDAVDGWNGPTDARAWPRAGVACAVYAWLAAGLLTARLGGTIAPDAGAALPLRQIASALVGAQLAVLALLLVAAPIGVGRFAMLVEVAALAAWLHAGAAWALLGGRAFLGPWLVGAGSIGGLLALSAGLWAAIVGSC